MWISLKTLDFTEKTRIFLPTLNIEQPVLENENNLSPKNQHLSNGKFSTF